MPDTDGSGAGVATEMAEKMRIKEGDDERTVLSKKLSYVLRHGAKQLDLEVDDSGYVRINDLLACDELFGGVASEALLEVVKLSNVDKQRYEISEQDGESFIRATGKHTMQGLARAETKKKSKRLSREAGASTSGAGGDRQRPSRQITEEEFCSRWRLDRLARIRLTELPTASRQLAMQQFSPGPQVPASDFPKVFVAFCKRFRQKGKDDGLGLDMDDDFEVEESPGNSRAGAANRSRGKKKSGRGREVDQAPAGGFTSSSHGHVGDTFDTMQPSSKVGALSLVEVDSGHMNPYYPSPGSTPRSDASPERGLLLHAIAAPVSSPTSPSNSLPAALPPPTASPPTAVRMMLPQPPPPPTHAPQVPSFNGFVLEGASSSPHNCHDGYQEMVTHGYEGVFNRDAYGRFYNHPQMYQRQSTMHGYLHSPSSHTAVRAQMSPQGYFAPIGYRNVLPDPSSTMGNEVYRGRAVGHAWTPAVDEYGACY